MYNVPRGSCQKLCQSREENIPHVHRLLRITVVVALLSERGEMKKKQ